MGLPLRKLSSLLRNTVTQYTQFTQGSIILLLQRKNKENKRKKGGRERKTKNFRGGGRNQTLVRIYSPDFTLWWWFMHYLRASVPNYFFSKLYFIILFLPILWQQFLFLVLLDRIWIRIYCCPPAHLYFPS